MDGQQTEKTTNNAQSNVIVVANHWSALIKLIDGLVVIAALVIIFILAGRAVELCKTCAGENCRIAFEALKTMIQWSFGTVGFFIFCTCSSPGAVAGSIIKMVEKIRRGSDKVMNELGERAP